MSLEDQIAEAVVALLKREGLVVAGADAKKRVMTVAESAKYLQRSESSVRDMVRSGVLPKHVWRKLGGRIVLICAELDKWLESSG